MIRVIKGEGSFDARERIVESSPGSLDFSWARPVDWSNVWRLGPCYIIEYSRGHYILVWGSCALYGSSALWY